MNKNLNLSDGRDENESGLIRFAMVAVVVGALAGSVGALFRLSLIHADELRHALVRWAHVDPWLGMIVVVAICAACAWFAATLVQCYAPVAAGSGIPHVEAVLEHQTPPAPVGLIPIKFLGGVMAIGSGFALGREGPSVQMGASIGDRIGRRFGFGSADCLVLLAAGAGAGLATAFNAPIAGAIFVLEELVRRFDVRTTIGTFGASTAAITVDRLLLGSATNFHVNSFPTPDISFLPLFLIIGLVAGVIGVLYNLALIRMFVLIQGLRRYSVTLRAALIGAIVGIIGWCFPIMVGGGDQLTQGTLNGNFALSFICMAFLVRFGLGAVCYAAQTPGGLFAPMLVLGAQIGVILGIIFSDWFGNVPPPYVFGLVGMTALFTAVVRAPITGIALVAEMTGVSSLLLPSLAASFLAMLVPTFLGNKPIYDSLRELSFPDRQRSAPQSVGR